MSLCVQLIPQVSSLSWFTTAVPLIFVLTISAVKDANDDIVSSNYNALKAVLGNKKNKI